MKSRGWVGSVVQPNWSTVSFGYDRFQIGGHLWGGFVGGPFAPPDFGDMIPRVSSVYGRQLLALTGTSDPDLLISDGASDILYGLRGDDTLQGNGGNDTLNGGPGTDLMVGGTGNDLYFVDVSSDIVVEALNGGTDTVRFASFNYVLPTNAENMISIAPYGGWMVGNELSNVMTGSSSNDAMIGAGGADTMMGGLGNDLYYVETLRDVVIEAPDAGYDRIYTDISVFALPANVEELQGFSADNMRLTGNDLDNWIVGDRGNDTLLGGGGNDGLIGLQGNDVMTGGTGQDFFQFFAPLGAENIDRITDFNPAKDEFDLWRNGEGMFAALSSTGWLAPAAFKVIGPGGGTVDSNDRILYNQSSGQLFYDADGSGSQEMVQFAYLSNRAILTAADFWVFDL